ncbi:MAG: hypothetical protein Q9195_005011 [Heterodermia aff. obscurata]
MRHFLRFIDLDRTFDEHGFQKKFGATFKLNAKPAAFTNFADSLGPGGYAWNVVRSEADDLIFKHAAKCGARTYDGTKIDSIEFKPNDDEKFPVDANAPNPGRAVSANWSRKDGSSGKIGFDYVVDASGRAGVISTKYLKNRTVNEGLRNIAHWAYWKGAATYGEGTERATSPFFEALGDGSGWCWAIPLHNGTLSVGLVMRQDLFFAKKKAMNSASTLELYKGLLNLAPLILKLLEEAEPVSNVRQASDWSYSASTYAGPNYRIAGDAGCFIDPYFSSGVHLAFASGLSAALTIQAVRKGECGELTAAKWHTTKVSEGYTRFLLVVMTVLRQLRKQEQSLLGDQNETGFESAFKSIQPVIQGTADTEQSDKIIQERAATSVEFALGVIKTESSAEEQKAVLEKVRKAAHELEELEKLTPDELAVLQNLREKQLKFIKGEKDLINFSQDSIEGFTPNLVTGKLGLMRTGGGGKNGKETGVIDLLQMTEAM